MWACVSDGEASVLALCSGCSQDCCAEPGGQGSLTDPLTWSAEGSPSQRQDTVPPVLPYGCLCWNHTQELFVEL